MRSPSLLLTLLLIAACAGDPEDRTEQASAPVPVDPATRNLADPISDPAAVEIAQATVEAMGGWDAWDRTRFVSFKFFGNRLHVWDRRTNDWRMEATDREGVSSIVLMNVDTREGRVWRDGEELAGEELAAALEGAHQAWVNDTYWMFMPFKLLDPGVTLKHGGETTLDDGRAADILVMTFADNAGYTPQNRYDVMVARDTQLVEAWSFYADRGDEEPRFTMPWSGWERFGEILIATDHGRGLDWDIAVHESLPRSIFEDPAAELPGAGDSETT